MKYHKNIHDTRQALDFLDYEPIMGAVSILKEAKAKKKTVVTFGNGGSHCNASHFAQDLRNTCGINAICISDMTPSILAYMNDFGIKQMFTYMLNNFKSVNTVLVAFSCSGNSENVFCALQRSLHSHRILFTGEDGGDCKTLDLTLIKVPNPNIRIQESCHSVICHAIIEALLDE